MSNEMQATENPIGLRFVVLGLGALALSMVMGLIASFKYLYPEALADFNFHQLRPLHVSLAVSWIFLAAIGSIYHYLHNMTDLKLKAPWAATAHFWIFLITGLVIIGHYVMGTFGGREYWAYPPILSLPIFLTWIMFGLNYFMTVLQEKKRWPVYYWMWGTGVIFFLITFTEAHLWVLPFFKENIVRELTVQWKAYGALVGSWNMLLYGTAMFVMERIGGDKDVAHSKKAFGLYFLSLTALMFGWAHHAYAVPMAESIRMAAYAVSMAELFILGKIIWDWRGTLTTREKCCHSQAYNFIFAADIWVFLNLILAILISIPAFNIYSHGTHITVSHAMGTTIGINTMILLGSVFFMIEEKYGCETGCLNSKMATYGYWILNISLFVFLGSLLMAGVVEGFNTWDSFFERAEAAEPYLVVFAFSGFGLLLGFGMVIIAAIKFLLPYAFARNGQTKQTSEQH